MRLTLVKIFPLLFCRSRSFFVSHGVFLSLTEFSFSLTEATELTEDAVAAPAENTFINDFEQSEKSNSVYSVHSV